MICVAISDKNIKNCLATIQNVDMAEIRLDLTEFDIKTIKEIFSQPKKLIATLRPGICDEGERINRLKTAIKAGAKYVDLEYESDENYRKGLIDYAHRNNCDVIISYHNFRNTPETDVLNKIVKDCFEYGADVAKVVTTAKTNIDNSRILSLYNSPGRIVAFCMGCLGKITRIIAPFMGSEITYASMDEGKATAPGQIKYSDMKDIIHKLEGILGK
jgi:3-dehydroquinate dehydratase type I